MEIAPVPDTGYQITISERRIPLPAVDFAPVQPGTTSGWADDIVLDGAMQSCAVTSSSCDPESRNDRNRLGLREKGRRVCFQPSRCDDRRNYIRNNSPIRPRSHAFYHKRPSATARTLQREHGSSRSYGSTWLRRAVAQADSGSLRRCFFARTIRQQPKCDHCRNRNGLVLGISVVDWSFRCNSDSFFWNCFV
jgi:hypothetical protein